MAQSAPRVPRASMWRVPLAAAVAAAACATSAGDGLMRERSYAEAEAAYDSDLAAAPGDASLRAKRETARVEAVRAKLEQAREVRGSGHGDAALSVLADALALETRWSPALPPDVAALRDGEIAGAGEGVAALIRPQLDGRAPLSASKRVEKLLPLLGHPRLAAIRDKIAADIAAAGKARCGELAVARSPYVAQLAAGYCRVYGVTVAAPATPDQRRGLRVSGNIDNTSDAQRQLIETWVAAALRQSAWFAPDAAAAMPLALAGRYDAKLERKQVTLSAPYKIVDRSTIDRGPLRQPLTIETESERVFPYTAELYDARYHLDATLTLQLADGQPPMSIHVDWSESRKAYEHEVNFPPARVYPQKANLPTINTWLSQRLAHKEQALVNKLQAHWKKAFCAAKSFSAEEGARCLTGSGDRVQAAAAALAQVFGEDTDLILDGAARARRPTRDEAPKGAKPEKPAEPARPQIEETTTERSESI